MTMFSCIFFIIFILSTTSQIQDNIAEPRTLYSKLPIGEFYNAPIKTSTSNRFYYNNGASCTERCQLIQLNVIEKDSCMDKCAQQSKFKMIMTEIFIGVIAIIIIILIIYTEGCKGSQNNIRNVQENDIAQRKILKQQYFDSQILIRNKICSSNMTEQEFQTIAKQFSQSKWIFRCTINKNPHIIQNYAIQLKKINSFIYELMIGGISQLGTWSMNGYYMNTSQGIQLWAMKNYDNPDYAGQAQQWDRLMFEGTKAQNENYYHGRWYYVGYQSDPQYCSKWSMEIPNALKQLSESKEILLQ